ncbi:hypothetical protein RFI_14989 [Reticulomyxa filosa]|uniref:Uncharacterized protein n=1 Tax=Reticulomyxa filosa TaxID=46433 RepID=X6N8X4_RETFI|nr:hypothetical protein RFI_14989 [Reticulomyxa filosa]|eukprot:ETO22209.1 hypothetical protein RFI_14989 [Reticulomyxa filosa]
MLPTAKARCVSLTAEQFVEGVFERNTYALTIEKLTHSSVWFSDLDEKHIISLIWEFSGDNLSTIPSIRPNDVYGYERVPSYGSNEQFKVMYIQLMFKNIKWNETVFCFGSIFVFRGSENPWTIKETCTCWSISNTCTGGSLYDGTYVYNFEILTNNSACFRHNITKTSDCYEKQCVASQECTYRLLNASYQMDQTITLFRKNETLQQNPSVCDQLTDTPNDEPLRKETIIIAYVYHFAFGGLIVLLLSVSLYCVVWPQSFFNFKI